MKRIIDNTLFLSHVLFWAAIWGTLEATVGYVLHLFNGAAGFLMFPIGVFCMMQVYRVTGSRRLVFMTALFTAAIKAINLVFPVGFGTIGAMTGIILEGMITAFLIPFLSSKRTHSLVARVSAGFTVALAMSFGWRILFLGAQLIINPYSKMLDPERWLGFLGVDSLMNAVIILGIVAVVAISEQNSKESGKNRSFVAALIALFIAAVAQFLSFA